MNEISMFHFSLSVFGRRSSYTFNSAQLFSLELGRSPKKTKFLRPKNHFTTWPSKGRWTRFCLSIHVQSNRKKQEKAHVESSPSCLPFLCFRNFIFRYFFRVLLPFSNVKSEANLMCTQYEEEYKRAQRKRHEKERNKEFLSHRSLFKFFFFAAWTCSDSVHFHFGILNNKTRSSHFFHV